MSFPLAPCEVENCSESLSVVGQLVLVLGCTHHKSVYHPATTNPLQPYISIHILPSVLYTFPKVLTRRIYLTFKSFFS